MAVRVKGDAPVCGVTRYVTHIPFLLPTSIRQSHPFARSRERKTSKVLTRGRVRGRVYVAGGEDAKGSALILRLRHGLDTGTEDLVSGCAVLALAAPKSCLGTALHLVSIMALVWIPHSRSYPLTVFVAVSGPLQGAVLTNVSSSNMKWIRRGVGRKAFQDFY
ncbi:hypothetical protein FA13DRAFT_1714399 [Coprinellus micaceus]|uniref:Uncharacterized protein n=1 Tax=Coprinellus micaceus TaxID=71717 RepID=A0A4Y7SSB0_COPMI|nr:hypothetical protein FA13DRAFT_1714399 [Coprinellus micaceus]